MSMNIEREAMMVGRGRTETLVRRPLSRICKYTNLQQFGARCSSRSASPGRPGRSGCCSWWVAGSPPPPAPPPSTPPSGSSPFLGILALVGLTAVAWYHTLAGIRHLYWDSGRGYEIPTMYMTGRMVLIGTAVMTVLTWLIMLISW